MFPPCRLIPLLVQKLRYSEEDLADLPEDDVVDEHIPDSVEDVRPFAYRAKDEEDDPGRGPVRVQLPSVPAALCAC